MPEQESDELQNMAHSQRISYITPELESEIEEIQTPIVGAQLQRWVTQGEEEAETGLLAAEAARRAALERTAHWERESEEYTAGESANLRQLPNESETAESRSRELFTVSNAHRPPGEDRQDEKALMNYDHQSQFIAARRPIKRQSPSTDFDDQIVTCSSHTIARRQATLSAASNELQGGRTHFSQPKPLSANESLDISDDHPLADRYESTSQEIEIHEQTDDLHIAKHVENEFKGIDDETPTRSDTTIEGKRNPMALMNFSEEVNEQAIGLELVPPNSASCGRPWERQRQALDSVPITVKGTEAVKPEFITSLTGQQQGPLIGNRQIQMDSQPSFEITRQIPDVNRDRPVFDLTDLSEEQIAEYELTGNLPPTLRADYDLEEHSGGEPAATTVQLGVRSGRLRQAVLDFTSQDEEEKMTESQIVPFNGAPSQPVPKRPELDSMSLHDRQTMEERSSQLVPSKGALPGRGLGRERPALSSVPYESDSEEEAGVGGNALVPFKDILRERERPQLDSVPFEDRERMEETGTDLVSVKARDRRPEGLDSPRTLDSVSYEDRQGPAHVNPSFLRGTGTYDEIDEEHPIKERRQRLLGETADYPDESEHEESGGRVMETTKMNVKPLNFRQDDVESEREVADTDKVRTAISRRREKLADPISPYKDNVAVPRQRTAPTRIITNKPDQSTAPLSGSTVINSSDEEEFASQTDAQLVNIKNMEADQTAAIKKAVADNPELARKYEEARLKQRQEDGNRINHKNGYTSRRQNKGTDDSDTDAEDLDRIPSQSWPSIRRGAFVYETDSTNDTVSIHIESDEDTHAPASQQPSRPFPPQLTPRRQPSQEQEPSSPDPLRSLVGTISSEDENKVSTESINRTPAEVARDHWKNQSDRERQQRANEDQAQKPSTQVAGSDQQSDDEPAPADSQSQEKIADSTGRQRSPLTPTFRDRVNEPVQRQQPRKGQLEENTTLKEVDNMASPLSPDSKHAVERIGAKRRQGEILFEDDIPDVEHELVVDGQQKFENPQEKPYHPEDELPSPKTQPDRPQEMDQQRKERTRFGHGDRRGHKENLDEEIILKMSKKELREQRLEDRAKKREAAEGRENERDKMKDKEVESKQKKERKQGDDQRSRGGKAKEGRRIGDDEKDGINSALYNSRIALGPMTLIKASWHILKTAPVWSFFAAATLALYIEVSRQLFEMLSVAAGTAVPVLTKRATSNSTPVDLFVTQSWFSDFVRNLSFEPTAFFAFISMWSIICIPIMGLLIHKTLSVAAEPKGTSYWKYVWQSFKEYGRGSLRVLIMGRHFSTPRVFWRRSTRWTYLRILIFSVQLVGIVLINRQVMSLVYMVGTGSSTSFSSLPDVVSSQKSMKEVAGSLDGEGTFAILNFLFFLFLLTIAGSWYALLHPRIRSLSSKKSSFETTDNESNSGGQGRYHLPGVRTSLKWLFILVIVIAFTASLLYFRDIASYITKQSSVSASGNLVIFGVNCIFMSLMAAIGYVVYELDKIWVGKLKAKVVWKFGKGFKLFGCWRGKDESAV